MEGKIKREINFTLEKVKEIFFFSSLSRMIKLSIVLEVFTGKFKYSIKVWRQVIKFSKDKVADKAIKE